MRAVGVAHRVELAVLEVAADFVLCLSFFDVVFEEVVVGLADLVRVRVLYLLH